MITNESNWRLEYSLVAIVVMVSFSCSENEEDSFVDSRGKVIADVWSIPKANVLSGGVIRDGIPSIDNPQFISVSEVLTISESDLVVGFKNGDDIRAYPHDILDQHEIVNDDISGNKIALNYCPLTGTAMAWNRELNGQTTTFGVSGLLFNTNLMPFDRETNSVWSQMLVASVNGSLINQKAELMPVVEMPWSEWKELYPNSKVMSRETGFARSYNFYPYGSYRETNQLLFPVQNSDDRLFGKERVLGVIVNRNAKVYQFDAMDADGEVTLIEDSFEGQDLFVVGNKSFMVAFSKTGVDGAEEFEIVSANLPIAFQDNLGNRYDVFGEVVSGPNQGERLDVLESYIGFFFSFPAFFGTPEIYGME